jgi:hypothetical protein
MKTARISSGVYAVTGHTRAGDLVQYEITREGSGWHTIGWFVTLVYGKGETFKTIYATKADAVKVITNQG